MVLIVILPSGSATRTVGGARGHRLDWSVSDCDGGEIILAALGDNPLRQHMICAETAKMMGRYLASLQSARAGAPKTAEASMHLGAFVRLAAGVDHLGGQVRNLLNRSTPSEVEQYR